MLKEMISDQYQLLMFLRSDICIELELAAIANSIKIKV